MSNCRQTLSILISKISVGNINGTHVYPAFHWKIPEIPGKKCNFEKLALFLVGNLSFKKCVPFTGLHKLSQAIRLGRDFEFLDGKGNECNPAFSTRRTFPLKCPQTFRKWKTPVDLTTKSIDCKTVGFFSQNQ